MDELRNLLVIMPALGAIIVPFVCFILNDPYNKLKNRYNAITKEYSKVESCMKKEGKERFIH
ncbi:hypothetical protein C3B64_06370 [Clostridium botulinum]|uniref:Phage protein n=1 Tax=Clostridium botulinum TaxID=1491 RepID=A0AAU8YUG4_CLOBO|nr:MULTISPECIES: hypothetical protein [Clostridium]AVP63896.1 hypothetical protein C3B64_06370 [Clostridium botulinum]MBA4510060.1 hypothetical protein [Clostridium sporogenes]MCF4017208.1 hypothetical protein [Clostridium sporogenes]MCW6059828.1 hypothetical protein [Clostridium sporogenes]MCW6067219.1 hypothetical protein [Clostridium sporogenes]